MGSVISMHLKVASDDEKVDAIPSALLAGFCYGGIDSIECTVALEWLVVENANSEKGKQTQPSTATRTPCVSNVSVVIFSLVGV